MSSFINSPIHFNSVEAGIIRLAMKDDFYFHQEIGNMYPYLKTTGHPYFEQRSKTIKKIIDQLRMLQVICVCLQYKHHYEGSLDQEIKDQTGILMSNKKPVRNLSDVALYKACCCLDYQIEIDHLTELRPLTPDEKNAYEFLGHFRSNIAEYIINRMVEYNDVKWSIE